jgi:hypothetical protein
MKVGLFLIALLLLPLPAFAGMAEAKDLARNYNCQVQGINLVGQETGIDGRSLYEVTCSLPSSASEDDRKANGKLLIACNGGLCSITKKGG